MSAFREAVEKRDRFIVTCEHVPPRGYEGKGIDRILEFANDVKDVEEIQAVTVTDNAGGNPTFSADTLSREIKDLGADVIVHFTCKDMNRNALETRAYTLARDGLENLLVITGDYPISGFLGRSKPVFDIDSVMALHHLDKLNKGLENRVGSKTITLKNTNFLLGAAASPFKWTEASSVLQYYKLEKKIETGAKFIVTQLGYDSRKYYELYQYVRHHLKHNVALLGSVYVLTSGAARFFETGEVPGVYLNHHWYEMVKQEAQAEDKGKESRLDRAAKQIAVLKGIGYDGVHMEGLGLKKDDVVHTLEKARDYEKNWRDLVPEFDNAPGKTFYFFKGGEVFDNVGNGSKAVPVVTKPKGIGSLQFWMMRMLHKMFFVPNTLGYKIMRAFSKFSTKRPRLNRFFTSMEAKAKSVMFDCRHCADCSLFDTFYLCPESKCAKGSRNGPCGGSRVDGKCEVFPERDCFWERVYWRAKNRGELENLKEIILPRDWDLYESSSWFNYFLGQDHSAKKPEVEYLESKKD